MIKIVLDCYGGDTSPAANIDGAVLALERFAVFGLAHIAPPSSARKCGHSTGWHGR